MTQILARLKLFKTVVGRNRLDRDFSPSNRYNTRAFSFPVIIPPVVPSHVSPGSRVNERTIYRTRSSDLLFLFYHIVLHYENFYAIDAGITRTISTASRVISTPTLISPSYSPAT